MYFILQTFWVSGSCPYGKRCCFIHTELPPNGAAGEGPPPPRPGSNDGRARSLSTNSDPNEQSVSLLARIAKREPANTNAPTPTEATPTTPFQFTRPPTGSLRVDTSVEASVKQNKSAYPTFASNGVLIHAPDRIAAKSPAPVTAGPDLGRHNNSRLEIVGYPQVRRFTIALA
jgi:tristetraprolin